MASSAPFRAFLRLWLRAALGLSVAVLFLDRLFPPPLAALDRPAARLVLDREGEPLRFLIAADQRWRLPLTLDEVPEEFIRALLASEDQRFWRHAGVDPLALARAVVTNLRAGEVVSGASTLPMQLARMAEPRRRNLLAKALEALRALQISARWSKRRQLETYLNLAPYGGNVEGLRAAAWFYFGKAPEGLSLAESALLIALPRSPTAYDPVRSPQTARRARDLVLGRMGERGVFPRALVEEALAQPLPRERRAAPFLAPHFSLFAAAQLPAERRLRTTLDRGLQTVAERTLKSRMGELRARGIANAAAVVIELPSRAVRAWVGSADFFEPGAFGQVDGVVAERSPGSTLKPLLYALAFDQGKIVPDSYLLDVPTDFAGYVAENYDGTYRGRVTAARALVLSLNSPAVRLLSTLGLPPFLSLLQRGGLSTLDRGPGHYGLPLILGAGEVRLLDLTNLYATLAEGGEHRPFRILEPAAAAPPAPADRLLSARAVELVTRALVELERPDLPASWDLARQVPTVAWKTGTSYGHRDAWAVGFSGRFAIGVWVGNFDGRPVLGISGAEHAGPLLFDLFRSLGDDSRPALLRAPEIEDLLEVCAGSHELPGPYCPARVKVPYLRGATRLPSCRMHRRVFVDRETGELLAGACLATRPHEARVIALEPPELTAFWRATGQRVEPLPRPAPGCGSPLSEPPRIVSPDARTAYRFRRDAPAEFQRIPLLARAGPYARQLFWYQDGDLVARSAPGERRFVLPELGQHEVVVVDDTGLADTLRYRVE